MSWLKVRNSKLKLKPKKKCIDLWTKQTKVIFGVQNSNPKIISKSHTHTSQRNRRQSCRGNIKIYLCLSLRKVYRRKTNILWGPLDRTQNQDGAQQSKLTLCFDVFIFKPKQKQKSSTKNIFVYYRDNQKKISKFKGNQKISSLVNSVF